MSWLSKLTRKFEKEVLDDALGINDKATQQFLTGRAFFNGGVDESPPAASTPEPLPQPSDQGILQSLFNSRRQEQRRHGKRASMITGGLFSLPTVSRPSLSPLSRARGSGSGTRGY